MKNTEEIVNLDSESKLFFITLVKSAVNLFSIIFLTLSLLASDKTAIDQAAKDRFRNSAPIPANIELAVTASESRARALDPDNWEIVAAKDLSLIAAALSNLHRKRDEISIANRIIELLDSNNLEKVSDSYERGVLYGFRGMIRDKHLNDSIGAESDYQAAFDLGVENPEWMRRLKSTKNKNKLKSRHSDSLEAITIPASPHEAFDKPLGD